MVPISKPKVVVIGAGFAGISAIKELAAAGAEVTLIDRNIYSTFQPLLYQVATGGLNPGDVAYPVRAATYRHDVRFRHGTVEKIDREGKAVLLDDGTKIGYDFLIIATGATVNHFGVPGAADHSLSLYTRRDAISVRDRIMSDLEKLAAEGGDRDLSLVVVGGGATGVEMAGTLAELRNAGLSAGFPEIDSKRVHVVLVEQMSELLGPFHPKLRSYTLKQLRKRGVDVRLDATIEEVRDSAVLLKSGEEIPADVTIWAAGIAAPASVAGWGLPQGRGGRIKVSGDLRVEGSEEIFATGDIAFREKDSFPQLAQPAIQSGRHAARQIGLLASGQSTKPFVYKDKGTMATIGRRAAIVELPIGLRLTGTLAWFAWLGLHVWQLLGSRNRVSAMLNLSWRYVAWPRGSGIIVGDTGE